MRNRPVVDIYCIAHIWTSALLYIIILHNDIIIWHNIDLLGLNLRLGLKFCFVAWSHCEMSDRGRALALVCALIWRLSNDLQTNSTYMWWSNVLKDKEVRSYFPGNLLWSRHSGLVHGHSFDLWHDSELICFLLIFTQTSFLAHSFVLFFFRRLMYIKVVFNLYLFAYYDTIDINS